MRYTALLASLIFLGGSTAHATAYPSLSCVFTEPFVGVEVWPGGASLITPEATRVATARKLGGTTLEPAVTLTVDRKKIALRIQNIPGSDGMSDFERPLTGYLTGYLMATPQTGACLRYPDGTTPRPVTGVAATKRLIIRDRALPSARVVGQLGPRARFWAFPEPVVRGWTRGAFEKIPVSSSGKITTAIGWVRAAHLGRPGGR
jgi:hypothetical protein